MDPETAEAIKYVATSTGVIGSISALAFFWYRTIKSGNDSAPERTRAQTEYDVQKTNAFRELMAQPGFADYIRLRKEIAEDLTKKDPDLLRGFNEGMLEKMVDSIAGSFSSQ